MNFTKSDLLQIDNLLKALGKGSFTLEGLEVLAMANAMRWLSSLQASMKSQLENNDSIKESTQIVETVKPISDNLPKKKTKKNEQ